MTTAKKLIKKMMIKVPFVYEAKVIMPRCRKAISVTVKDSISVEIKEYAKSEISLAFKIGTEEIFLHNKALWVLDFERTASKKDELVKLSTVKENTENGGRDYRYSRSGTAVPFLNYWNYVKSNMENGKDAESKDVVLNNCREWIEDDRSAIIKEIKKIARNLIAVDGYMFCKTTEPRYEVITFGLGRNHGGTALFVVKHFNENIMKKCYFTALQYKEACELANETAKNRGDNSSIPVKVNGGAIIEVLMPSAVKIVLNR